MLQQKGPPRVSEDTEVKAQAQTGVITILRTPFLGRTWRQKRFLLLGDAFLSLTLAPMAASLPTPHPVLLSLPRLPACALPPSLEGFCHERRDGQRRREKKLSGQHWRTFPSCQPENRSSPEASFLPIPILLSLPRESSSFCLLDQIRPNNVAKSLDIKEATVSRTPMRNICKPFLHKNVIIQVGYVYSTVQPQYQIFCDLKVIFVGLTWLPSCPYKIVAVGKSTQVPEKLLITHLPSNQLSLLYGWPCR